MSFDRTVSVSGAAGSLRIYYADRANDATLPQDAVATYACSSLVLATTASTTTASAATAASLVASPVAAGATRPAQNCFTVDVPSNCVRDATTNFYLTGASWNFCISGPAAPTVVTYSPAIGSSTTAVGSSTITLVFDSEVVAGCSGAVSLYSGSDSLLLSQVTVVPSMISSVTVSGKSVSSVSVTFPSAYFTQSSALFVRVSAGAFRSARGGVSFAGITDSSFNFEVAAAVLAGAGAKLSGTSTRSDSSVPVGLRANTVAKTINLPSGYGYIKILPNTIPDVYKDFNITVRTRTVKRNSETNVKGLLVLGSDLLLEPAGAKFFGPVKVCTKYNTKYRNPTTLTGDLRTASLVVTKKMQDANKNDIWVVIPQVPEFDDAKVFVCVQMSGFSEIVTALATPRSGLSSSNSPGSTLAPGSPPSGPGTITFAGASSVTAPAVAMLLALAALLAALL